MRTAFISSPGELIDSQSISSKQVDESMLRLVSIFIKLIILRYGRGLAKRASNTTTCGI